MPPGLIPPATLEGRAKLVPPPRPRPCDFSLVSPPPLLGPTGDWAPLGVLVWLPLERSPGCNTTAEQPNKHDVSDR
jgi:hypothetical protein